MSRRFPNSIYSIVDPPRNKFRRRGKGNPNADFGDRPGDDGRRHYRQYHRPVVAASVEKPKTTTILPEKPTEDVLLPEPPLEHYYIVLWLKKALDDEQLKSLQKHLQRRFFLIDIQRCMILIEGMRKQDFPRMHFASNRYTLTEYRAADLPFEPFPKPYIP